MKNRMLQKIKDKKAQVGILGMGYVGLPLARATRSKLIQSLAAALRC